MAIGNYSSWYNSFSAGRGLQSAGGSGAPETGSAGSAGSCGSCGSTGYDVPWGGYQSSGGSAESAGNTGGTDNQKSWLDYYHEERRSTMDAHAPGWDTQIGAAAYPGVEERIGGTVPFDAIVATIKWGRGNLTR